jgi:hypothetical protein
VAVFFLRFLDHTQLDTDTLSRTPTKRVTSSLHRPYIHNTLHTRNTKENVRALIGVQSRDPRNETAADVHLRPHGPQFQRSHIAFCHYSECRYLLRTDTYAKTEIVLSQLKLFNNNRSYKWGQIFSPIVTEIP